MTALGPKAHSLVQAGRSALRPAEDDRQRIEAALRARLGPAALPPEGSVAPPPVGVVAASWKAVAGAVVGAGLLGGALYLALAPERSPASEAPPPVLSAAVTPAPAPEAPRSEGPAVAPSLESAPAASVAAPPAPLAASPAPSAPRTRDRLAEEVALLSRAMTALRTGRAGEALTALEEHQSKFPRGALGEERRAAKAQALCSLGRTSEGRAELARLAPESPAAARAKEVCDPGSRSGPR